MKTPFLTMQKIQELLPDAAIFNSSEIILQQPIRAVSTDSRKIQASDFFIAIRGEKFDGNQYLGDVFKKGAMGALASNPDEVPQDQPVLLVKDTLLGLQELAMKWRLEVNPLLVLVTGSNGKTTVKEMIASIFRQSDGAERTLATPGNLNNEIGLPLTLLGLNHGHHSAVIELGMNHPGETNFLAQIARPNISLINNAQREHQEFMQTVEAVAIEHGDAISALGPDGVAIFPADSAYTALWKNLSQGHDFYDFELVQTHQESQAKVKGAWLSNGCLQIHLPKTTTQNEETISVHLSTLGDHNAKNAIAATAVAWAAGVSSAMIRDGLEKFEPVAGRMRSHELPHFGKMGCLIDDTYNANPDSVLAAINVLAKMPGQRWLILGDMGEVGDQGDTFHQEIGAYAKQMGVHYLYATGPLSKHSVKAFEATRHPDNNLPEAGIHFAEAKALLKKLTSDLQEIQMKVPAQAVSILVKGSRFTKMERIVNCLLKEESLCF
jgi:UDP-N-acetylmuramoyl-tripeptide--D-alanyl-D-alanine ligase